MFWNERPVGTLSITSRVTTTCCLVFWRSTTGDWPETVIVSATLPTCRSALMAAVNPVVSSNALAPDGVEALQRKGDGVGARPQLGDLIPAFAIRHRSPDFFNERRTGRFDGYARQDGAGCIANNSCDAACCGLRLRPGGHAKQRRDENDPRATSCHRTLPWRRGRAAAPDNE